MNQYANLIKGQDEEAYKKLAQKGMDLIFPVSVNGKTHRPDIGIRYHNSIKIFNPDKDNVKEIHGKADKLDLAPPNPKEVGIEPTILEGRGGYKMHVLRMHGPHADKIKQHNNQFKEQGHEQNYEFHPHVTVDKETWDRVKSSGAKTAHEAGLSFHHAELRHGPKIISRYGKKLAATEKSTLDSMEKGFMRNVGTALGVASAIAAAPGAQAKTPIHKPTAITQQAKNPYSSKRMLNTISSVESQHGKNIQHRELAGIHSGESAYGKYGLTPNTIRETIKMNRDLKAKHQKAMALRGHDLHRYMADNPGLEDAVAQKHLKRLEHHFGQDPAHIGYAWLNGIKGTYKAKQKKTDIGNHWHVLKIKDAYDKEK